MDQRSFPLRHLQFSSRPDRRRGIAVLIVLLLIALTLGLSYAALRTQTTAVIVQNNYSRRAAAQQAALTGLVLGLTKMQKTSWAGVDTTLTGTLGDQEGYSVTFTTGDPDLAPSDPDYPYRVTLEATGSATDPGDPQRVAMHRAQAVVQLIPRELADEPPSWNSIVNYTYYQWTSGAFNLCVPFRIEGKVRVKGVIALSTYYPWSGDPQDQYYSDLNAMRLAGGDDYRPFNERVYMNYSQQSYDTFQQLSRLGIPTSDTSPYPASGISAPTSFSAYQIYPGGKQYNVPQLPQTLEDVIYQPDPETNPLGLFFRQGMLEIKDDVTIRGTLITRGDSGGNITIKGKRVTLEAVSHRSLLGESDPVQMPMVVAGYNFWLTKDTITTITGIVAAMNEFKIDEDNDDDIELNLFGKVISKSFNVPGRKYWDESSGWWEDRYEDFEEQEDDSDGIPYFPEWLDVRKGKRVAPYMTIKPQSTDVRYHWHNTQNTLYVAHPDDGGLRWDVLKWKSRL